MAETLLGENIEVSVLVEIDDPVPFPDIQIHVGHRSGKTNVGFRWRTYVFEMHQDTRVLLNEKVLVTVSVNINELRTRYVESAQKREAVRHAHVRRELRTGAT